MCWRTQDEITTKANNGPNFQYIKFLAIELVLTDRRNISGTCQNRPRVNLLVLDFRSQRWKIPLPKALNWGCRFRFFFFVFWFSCSPSKVWTSLSVSGTDFLVFSSHKLKKFWQTTLDCECWRLCRLFINQTKWRERDWRVSSWSAISNTREKNSFFFPRVVTAFLRAGIHV